MSNSVEIFVNKTKAGLLERTNDGEYLFTYDQKFLEESSEPISLTMPLREEPYVSEVLHPFFDGLIPEGWLLDLAIRNWKLKQSDRFELLKVTCADAVGAVSVKPQSKTDLNSEKGISEKPELFERGSCPNTNTEVCMISYKPLSKDQIEKHELYTAVSSNRMFGTKIGPKCVGISSDDLLNLGKVQIESGLNLTGVQKKMSLGLVYGEDKTAGNRLTYLKEGGEYILKPQSEDFELLPETEHLCMKLAEVCKFDVPPCALIPLKSGELAYLIKRFDRKKKKKFYQEDFCQLSGKPTSEKYLSSVEKCAKLINSYCTNPKVNLALFYDIVLFNYIIGNADMHLKNYSLVKSSKNNQIELSPCYDYVSTKLLMPEDEEDTALTINGKKSNIKVKDWVKLAENMGLGDEHFHGRVKQFLKWEKKFYEVIGKSFVSPSHKEAFKEIIKENLRQLSEK